MNIKGLLFTSAALLIFSTPSAFAQSQPAGSSTAPAPGTVGERKENQQDRIANGIQSGQLTAGETKNLETKEAGLNKEEHTMRSEDDGHLTAADPEKLNNTVSVQAPPVLVGGVRRKTVPQPPAQLALVAPPLAVVP